MKHNTGLICGLRGQIVAQLRNDIYAGRLASGERLSEVSLAERFNVSRTPIREALHQLTQEGLLESKPNYGVRVAAKFDAEIQELIISIRCVIETFALQSCYDSLTEEDFLQWDEIIRRMGMACENRDFSAIADIDLEFHHAIVLRTGIPYLEVMWNMIASRVRIHFRDTHKRYLDPMHIHAEHVEILNVFRGGDCEAAIDILSGNIG